MPDISLGQTFQFRLESDNVLCISNWKMAPDNDLETEQDICQLDFDDSDWLKVTIGAWEMQLPQERDDESYPVTLWYRTSFETEYLPSNTRLLIDGFSGEKYQLFMNGNEIKEKGKPSKLDAEIKEVNIQPFIKKGHNVVAVKLVVTRRTDGILDLLKIVGDFALTPTDDGHKVVAPKPALKIGDWTKQGYPYYSGTGVYETEIDVPESYLNGKLFLNVDCGEDVLEMSINDNYSQIIPWHPYHIDVSDCIRAGKNKIVLKVTNTLINILEAVQKKSGIFKEPCLRYMNRYEFSITTTT